MSQSANPALVRLAQPGAGQTVTMPIDRNNMRMALEFAPDPNAVAKNGQDLEFSFEDGGKIVLQGYYDHFADKTLPVMVTETGDELPGEDFLASLREDLLTAAGPGAGAGAAGGGMNDYADDAGNLVDGIDRLGSLGTIYWDRATEVPEQYFGMREFPGGSGDFAIVTELPTDEGGRIVVGVYEDARPYQHEGNDENHYGRIEFTFSGTGTTVCDTVHLTGFDVGTVIYLGNPGEEPMIEITQPGQIVDIPAAQFETGGVYVKPPADSDGDMNISSTLDIHAESSGQGATIPGPDFVVVVDAVADKPDLAVDGEMATGFDDVELGGSLKIDETREGQDFADGWATDSIAKNSEEGSSTTAPEGVTVRAGFHSVIQFGDHADSSESHYALVQAPSQGNWEPDLTTVSPAGVTYTGMITLWYDAAGNVIAETEFGAQGPENAASSQNFFQFDVDGALDENGGVNLELDFISSDTDLTTDTTISLETGAKAVDTASDAELDTDNNVSYTFTKEYEDGDGEPYTPNFTVDTVDSKLNVKAGWTSEDGDNSQHADGAYTPGYGAMHDQFDGTDAGAVPGVEGNSTNAGESAPIVISIEGGDASGENTETITEVRLYFDPEAGDIAINGVPQQVAVDPETGRSYVLLTPENGGVGADGQSTANVTFVPAENNQDGDVNLSYTVTVKAEPSGAEAVYTGETTVVVDAVADQPTECAIDCVPDSGHAEAAVGETVTVTGSVAFADTDGSEAHYAVITFSDNFLPDGWSVEGVSGLAGKDALVNHWMEASGGKIPAAAVESMLDGMADSAGSLLVEVTYDEDGAASVHVYAANGAGELVEVTDAFPGCDSWYDAETGELNYTLTVNTPDAAAQDGSVQLDAKGVTLEQNPDGEYDFVNNIAGSESGDDSSTTIKLDTVTSGLFVGFKEVEDNDPDQQNGESAVSLMPEFGLPITLELRELDADGDITDEGAEITDYIASLTFNSLPDADGEGVIYYNGQPVTADNIANLPGATLNPDGTITFTDPDTSGFTFKPVPDFSGDVPFDVTATIRSGTSSATNTVTPQEAPGEAAYLHVDSVADQARIDDLEALGRAAGEDAEMTPNALTHEEGWAIQTSGDSETVGISFGISGKFTDVDGSESASIRILLPEGFSVPEGEGWTMDGDYAVLDLGAIGGTTHTVNGITLTVNPDGTVSYNGTLNLVVTSGTPQTSLDVTVVTKESDSRDGDNHSTANNTASNTETVDINVEYFTGKLEVKAGWRYEGDNADKDGDGSVASAADLGVDEGSMAGDIAAGNLTLSGAIPIEIAFDDNAGRNESLKDVTFSWDEEAGTLYDQWGMELHSPVTLAGGDVSGDGVKMYFVPNPSYSDEDINLNYTATFTDKGDDGSKDIEFTVNGTVDMVIDAVADQAGVIDTEVVSEDGDIAAVAGESADITIKLHFADDDSETRYVLIPKGDGSVIAGGLGGDLPGLTLVEDGGALADAGSGLNLDDYYVYEVDPNALDADGNLTVTVTVETRDDLEGDHSETLDIKTVVVEGKGNNEEAWNRDADPDLRENDDEYDFTNNVAITDVPVTVKVGGIDTEELTVGATETYEDNNPGQHTETTADDATPDGAAITISGLDDSEEIATVTFSFDPPLGLDADGQPLGDVGSFTYGGREYTLGDGITFNEATGKLELTIDDFDTNASLVYRPGENDSDADIALDFTATVRDTASGAEREFSGSTTIVVDAVADRPTDIANAAESDPLLSLDQTDVIGWTDTANWNASTGVTTTTHKPAYTPESFTFTISAEATFHDLDGSETMYLLVEVPNGCTVTSNDGYRQVGTVTGPDGKTYAKFEVTDDVDADGHAEGAFTLTTPELSGDTEYNIHTGGMAVDTPTDGEPDTMNNEAITIGDTPTHLVVDAVESRLVVNVGWAPEDNDPSQHLATGNYAPGNSGPYNSVSGGYEPLPGGVVNAETGEAATGRAAIVELFLDGTGDRFTEITFTYNAADGDFLYKETPYYEVTVSGPDLNGNITVTVIYGDSPTVSGTGNDFSFRPAADNDDGEIGLSYTAKAEGRDGNSLTYEGESTVAVDAVADNPEVPDLQNNTPESLNTPETLYENGENGQTAARKGENVTLTISDVQFDDYTDGSESHSLLVDDYATNGAKINLAEQTVTIWGLDANGVRHEMTVEIPAGATANADGYYHIDVPNDFLELVGGKVSATVDIIAPTTPTTDTQYTVRVGANAHETIHSGDREVDTANNNSNALDNVTFDVHVVTSKPEISVVLSGGDHIYENLTPNAHENPDKLVNADDGTPARLNLTGMANGETADVTLRFSATADDGSAVDFSGGYVTIGDDATQYRLTDADGDGVYTVDLPTLNGNATINFYPGANYSDDDISVDYDVKVTDPESGENTTWSTDKTGLDAEGKPYVDAEGKPIQTEGGDREDLPSLGINVDAVAQAPEVAVSDEPAYFPKGGDENGGIAVKATVTFQDYEDGSELHYLMVQAHLGYPVTSIDITNGEDTWTISENADGVWTLADENGNVLVTDADGNVQWVAADSIPEGYALYDCTPASGSDCSYKGNQYTQLRLPDELLGECDGELDITVNMDVPADASGDVSFIIGGMSHEDPNGLDDAEKTRDNNQAYSLDEAAQVVFEVPGEITVEVDKPVYEGDAPRANMGDFADVGGTEVTVILPEGNTTTEITFSCDRGAVYIFPDHADGTPMSTAEIVEAIKNGTAEKADRPEGYSEAEINGSTVIYVADDINDTDAKVTVTGKVTNDHTGESAVRTDAVEVLVDTVAQQPEVEKTADDGHGNVTLVVDFPDTDGSEDHYALIEAKPGATLVVNGHAIAENPDDLYYHKNADGSTTAYYKVPLNGEPLNLEPDADGAYTVDITYTGGGAFKYGAMGEDNHTDGEVTYHNNVSVVADGTADHIPGEPGGNGLIPDYIPPGGGHICEGPEGGRTWNDGAAENGTPNANVGVIDYGRGDAELSFDYIARHHDGDYDAAHPAPEGAEPGGSWCVPVRETPKEVTITFDANDAGLLIDGEYVFESDPAGKWDLTYNPDGTVTVTIHDYNDANTPPVALRPGDYSDAYADPADASRDPADYHTDDDSDIDYSWSMTVPPNDYHDSDSSVVLEGTGTVVVDAVAQGIVEGSVEDVVVADVLGEDEGNNTTTITLEAVIKDTDGSEDCYFLVEKVPGIEIEGVTETVYVAGQDGQDGKVYYKIPADSVDENGNATAEVTIRTPQQDDGGLTGGTRNADGSSSFVLDYGAMTQENLNNASGGESNYGNNASFDTSGKLEIKVSYVSGTVTVEEMEGVFENDARSGVINVVLDLNGPDDDDTNDQLASFTVTYDPEAGEIVYWKDTDNDGTVDTQYSADGAPGANFDDVFGAGNWEITYDADGNATLVLTGADSGLGTDILDGSVFENGNLALSTGGNYSDADTDISWTATIKDPLSGDTETFDGGQKVVIDSVAQAPEVENVHLVSETGNEAALSGGEAKIVMELTFADTDGSETHYAVLANEGEWTCGNVIVTLPDGTTEELQPKLVYDDNGDPYYGVEIKDEWLDADGKVKVEFVVNAPTVDGDTTYNLKGGGISVEPFTPLDPDGDGPLRNDELTLNNNWAENIKEYPVTIGVADSTTVTASSDAADENQAGETGAIAITFTADDAEDVVSSVTIDPRDVKNGTLLVNGDPAVRDANGKYVISGDDVNHITFQPNEHWSGSVDIPFTATVQDSTSGATNDKTYTGTAELEVTAVATEPTGVTDGTPKYASGLTAAQSGGNVTFQVTGTFPDHDGSEDHYILVEAKDGWGAPTGWNASRDGYYEDEAGTRYYKVPVPDNAAYDANGNVTVNITMKTPSGITADGTIDGPAIGALAGENGAEEAFFDGKDVDVVIGAVQSEDSDLTANATNAVEDGTAATGTASQLTFLLDGGNNESISAIVVEVPAGSYIYRDNGNGTWTRMSVSGGKVTLNGADAAAGKYSFQPAPDYNGDVELNYTATIRDNASGATDTVEGSMSLTVGAVTDGGTVAGSTVTINASDIAGHTAGVNLKLTGSFPDNDGSEIRYFLVTLPEGIAPADGWTEVEPGVYRVNVPEGHRADSYTSGNFALAVTPDYEGGDITYVAVSYEESLGEGSAKVSDKVNTVHVGQGEGLEYNLAPEVADDHVTSDNFLRNEAPKATGTLEMGARAGDAVTDVDGDVVTIAAVTGGGAAAEDITDQGTTITVETEYGTLVIDKATGEYTFTLAEGVTPPHGEQIVFDVTVTDGYTANPMGDTAQIVITLNGANEAPTATVTRQTAGGGNEDGEPVVITGNMNLTDADGDAITITKVGTATTMQEEGGRNFFEVAGQFGTLRVFADGSYEYTLTNEYATGQERFEVAFQDQFGAAYGGVGSAAIVIDVKPVNHAPTATDSMLEWNSDGYGIQTGSVAFSDSDTVRGQKLEVVVEAFDGTTETVVENGYTSITGKHGTLQINADGSYRYALLEGEDPDQIDGWDVFTYTVTDENGLSSQAQITVKLGDPLDPAAMPLQGMQAGGEEEALYGEAAETILVCGTDGELAYDLLGDGIACGTAGEDTFAWAATDLTSEGMDTILDFEMGSDKLLFESLFSDAPVNMKSALVDKIEEGALDIEVVSSQQVQVTMEGQIVDIHLSNTLDSAYTGEDLGTDAKAALLEMMLTQVTG